MVKGHFLALSLAAAQILDVELLKILEVVGV
jgi:hypothetical protein